MADKSIFIGLTIDDKEIEQSNFYIDKLRFTGKLSSVYKMELNLICNDLKSELFAEDFICKNTVVTIMYDEEERKLNGMISEFIPMHNYNHDNEAGEEKRRQFKLIIQPEFLSEATTHNKIYTEKATNEIVKDMLSVLNTTTLKESLNESYSPRKFCLHHTFESDLTFYNRILSEEGIYYYFNQSNKHPELILCDSKEYEESEVIFDLMKGEIKYNERFSSQIETFNTSDHDHTNPVDDKITSLDNSNVNVSKLSSTEFWPYPGPANKSSADGDKCLDLRIMKENIDKSLYQLKFENINDGLKLDLGKKFKVNWKDQKDSEIELAVINIEFTLNSSSYSSFACSVTAIEADKRFVPKLILPPYIPPAPAIVIGEDNSQRNLSEEGEVQIRFYWEKEGEEDYEPYWVRVAQLWAGNNYGTFFLPPIDTEVIIQFLYGPNRTPVIMGCLHDKAIKYPSDHDKFCTGIITKNEEGKLPTELIFDDTKDKEKFMINTAYDYDSMIQNNRKITVNEGDDALTLEKGSRALSITEGDEDITLEKGNRTVELKGPTSKHSTKAGEIVIEAKKKITLKVGGSSITIDPANIILDSSKIDVNATTLARITSNAMTRVSATAMITLEGALVKIN